MTLYESIINDIAKIVKSYLNEGKWDNFDHSHNTNASFLKKRVMMHYKGSSKYRYATKHNVETRKTSQCDITVRGVNDPNYNNEDFGLNVIMRKPESKSNFRIEVKAHGLESENVNYYAFMMPAGKRNEYAVYILPKDIIYEHYLKLLKLNKDENSRRNFNGNIIDDEMCFLSNVNGRVGICIPNDFLKKHMIDKFHLKEM